MRSVFFRTWDDLLTGVDFLAFPPENLRGRQTRNPGQGAGLPFPEALDRAVPSTLHKCLRQGSGPGWLYLKIVPLSGRGRKRKNAEIPDDEGRFRAALIMADPSSGAAHGTGTKP